MRTNGKFYIVNERSNKIKAWLMTPLPVVWNRDGKFCIVPMAVVQNACDSKRIYEKLDGKTTNPIVYIYWSQGIPISNQAGRALIGE